MTFEKFHGATVNEARKKAKEKLGQTYTVVETQKADNEKLAWINVLSEGRQQKTSTYSRQDLFPKALQKLKKTLNERLPLFDVNNQENGSQPLQQKPRQQTYDINDIKAPKNTSLKSVTQLEKETEFPLETKQNAPFKKEIQTLKQRFNKLEQSLSDQMTESHPNYINHPAFQQLLASGVPRDMITTWFDELVKSDVNLYDERGNFRQVLADKVRKTLDVAAGIKPAKGMLFTGPSAGGKSSLIMKLALRLTLLKGASCALVSVYPAKRENYYSPITEFTSTHNLAHYIIQDIKDLFTLKEKWMHFDHIFIEMLPEKRQKTEAISIKNFKEIFAIQSFEVHHVINAALNPSCLDRQIFFKDHSVRRYLDFTHLDETPLRGHLLPIMAQSGCKARYVTNGPLIPDDISVFEPAHFVKQLLKKT